MLKGLAAYVLNTYLGQYLEDLHADQLSIGLLNGKVELENVPLRKDALRYLQLPLLVKSGLIGKVRLQIPVTRLRSEPWIVVFEQLYVVAGYIDLNKYNAEEEQKFLAKHKADQLFSMEAAWRSKVEVISPEYSWGDFGTSIITEVIQNIQLEIKDVHIRFEDDISFINKDIAYGLTIDSLTVQTCDENWVPKFISTQSNDISYKILELKNLGIYSNSQADMISSESMQEQINLLQSAAKDQKERYILEPISCTACLKKNQSVSPLRSRSSPRFVCDVKFATLPLSLANVQYECFISTLQQYERLEIARPYRKWRPKKKIIVQNLRGWWQYAINCTLEEIRVRNAGRTWESVLKRSKDIVKYASIYKQVLKSSTTVPSEDSEFLLELEKEMNLPELKYIRSICMESIVIEKREAKIQNIQAGNQKNAELSTSPKETASKGVLQSWFPAWSGWYSKKSTEEPPEHASSIEHIETFRDSATNSLEEEFLDVISDSLENNTLLKRDAVFCMLSFTLKQASFMLSSVSAADQYSRKSMFELEFSDVKMDLESRPRHEAFKVVVQLGDVSVKDQVTPNTVFPLLISQQRENISMHKIGLFRPPTSMYTKLSNMMSSVSKGSGGSSGPTTPFFSLEYEKNPRTAKVDNKLIVHSQSLDVIYNKHAFDILVEFFSLKSLQEDEFDLQLSITEAAKDRYEQLKQKTKEELRKNWNTIVKGFVETERKKWDVKLNICAPQFIFPERYDDPNATLVVIDLGKLVFCTANTSIKTESDDQENSDDDTFITPCSTPDELTYHEEKDSFTKESEEFVSDSHLHDHLYDKYDLRLCDIQVLVTKFRENWKFACQKGTGTTHVVDRFNINLHFERRVLATLPEYSSSTEYQWPRATLSGSLPRLFFHINEHKVHSIKNMILSLVDATQTPSSGDSVASVNGSPLPTDALSSFTFEDDANDDDDSQLFIMQFGVEKLSVELQARGRSIAELQVTGVRAQVNKLSHEISALLSVHSLLLVDALQTFGPDFELLITSHKHITMDSVSGSLLDSEPCSPITPSSPDPHNPPSSTSPIALSQALSSIGGRASSPVDRRDARSPVLVSPTFGPFLSGLEEVDKEALISVEVTYVTPRAPDTESHLISSVQFNSLDVIANQETVVELVGFVQQMFSNLTSANQTEMKPDPEPEKPHEQNKYGSSTSLETEQDSKTNLKAEVTFDFHKFTVLLLRGVLKEKELVGRKVATAVISDAKIQMSLESEVLSIDGSLGGFQIRDINPNGNKHQRIISMGHDPIVERSKAMASQLHSGAYQPSIDVFRPSSEAFRFKVIRPLVLNGQSNENTPAEDHESSEKEQLTIELHLASVCYTHSPQFLFEVHSCASEFKDYMTKVAASIRQAATEMAIGLVSKRIESFASLSGREGSLRHQRQSSISKSTDTLHFPRPPPASTVDSHPLSPSRTVAPDLTFAMKLDVVLETPIIVLPEAPNSVNVLVAHLGQMTLTNSTSKTTKGEDWNSSINKVAEFKLCVKDMSLHSLNIDDKVKDISFSPLTTTMLCAEELYSCRDHGTPILHDTGIEIVCTQKRESSLLTEFESETIFQSDICTDQHPEIFRDTFHIEGGVVTPLKVSMSRQQYHQLLRSLDNISIPSHKMSSSLSNINETDGIKEHSGGMSPKTKQPPPQRIRHVSGSKTMSLLKSRFTIPTLCIELQGEFENKLQPLADLILIDICAVYEATQKYESHVEISLKSLTLEDLQLDANNSKLTYLMKSETYPDQMYNSKSSVDYRQFISSSCPEYSSHQSFAFQPSSLPSKVEVENPFHQFTKKQKTHKRKSVSKYFESPRESSLPASPSTPPPSPTAADLESKDSTLVTISIRNIDEKHPEFSTKFDETHRFVDVDFNTLVTVINIESWVMLLDFFRSIDTNSNDQRTENKEKTEQQVDLDLQEMEDVNTVMELKVKNLTLVLNQLDGELARASINQVLVRSVGSDGNLTLTGRLGSLSLIDRTNYGTMYPQKFLTSGDDAMTFQLFKYSTEDPNLERECDIRLNLKMASIVYVHSHRFTMELIEFVNQFITLRDILSDWRLYRAGIEVVERNHGTRLSLDISAGSPIILIPMSNFSDSVLVLNLGSLTVSNKFMFAGTEGTISEICREDRKLKIGGKSGARSRSHTRRSRSQSTKRLHSIKEDPQTKSDDKVVPTNCLLDVMAISLNNMDLIFGKRSGLTGINSNLIVWDFGTYAINRHGSSLLNDSFGLKLQVERNLDADSVRIVPDFSVEGIVSKVHITVDTNSYHLIRGLLEFNLGESFPEPKVSPLLLKLQNKNKPKTKIHFANLDVWTKLSINLELDDVCLDVGIIEDGLKDAQPLARVHFVKSRLTFLSNSDTSKDIDLVSQEILIYDTRYDSCSPENRPNVFTNILLPAQDQSLKNDNPLQAEIHYRATKEISRFTVILNNMRLMAIMDWWMETLDFIQSSAPASQGEQKVSPSYGKCIDQPSSKSRFQPKLNPFVESTGLMTKQSLLVEDLQVSGQADELNRPLDDILIDNNAFEFKFNITGSEVIAVENSSLPDTAALILKTTAVLGYRPAYKPNPISCNFIECELYSCILGSEQDTALSIVDPVMVHIEVTDRSLKSESQCMTELIESNKHVVEISMHPLNVRLSYHDMKMFLAIMESLPPHIERKNKNASKEDKLQERVPQHLLVEAKSLVEMGFALEDCIVALENCKGQPDNAATWLLENATITGVNQSELDVLENKMGGLNFHSIELKPASFNLCIIDDCGDCDVPLIELSLTDLTLRQKMTMEGTAKCTFSIDYYNRALSGWEPFIEPWQCQMKWNKSENVRGFRPTLESNSVMNITVTTTLIQLVDLVSQKWTSDFYEKDRNDSNASSGSIKSASSNLATPNTGHRRRVAFVPFAIVNETGCPLQFSTVIEDKDNCSDIKDESSDSFSKRISTIVQPGQSHSFSFEGRGKQRHGNTHSMKYHQLVVKVGDMSPVGPVIVDRVGVFFRLAMAPPDCIAQSVRIVFDISMDGVARKLIKVRSALLLTNKLPHPVELKLENFGNTQGTPLYMMANENEVINVPVPHIFADISAKPIPSSLVKYGYSPCVSNAHKPNWQATLHQCAAINRNSEPFYRFVVFVRHDNYPTDYVKIRTKTKALYLDPCEHELTQPGHSIFLVSPLTVVNLLPFDLHYQIVKEGDKGRISKGGEAFIFSVDPQDEIELKLWTDNLHSSASLLVAPAVSSYNINLKLEDKDKRIVYLNVRVSRQFGKSLKVTVYAHYWLINNSGLPLIFKQEGSQTLAAGQEEDHETGRCTTPLLFSFSDLESPPTLLVRIGKYLHPNASPQFCKMLPLTSGTTDRRLHVNPHDNRPPFVYLIGVDVRSGKGRYRGTKMVSFSPRLHIENHSSVGLQIAQKHFTSKEEEHKKQWLCALSGSWLTFHWPLHDRDHLLCVRLLDEGHAVSEWSGGFEVQHAASFNLNLRTQDRKSKFLHVEILLNDATFFIVFTNADSLPPPFRIDNFSHVPITFHQAGTHGEKLKTIVKPHTSLPYSLDEVTLPPIISCLTSGSLSEKYNLSIIGKGGDIIYENFIYIALTGTFPGSRSSQSMISTKENLSTFGQLVLSVAAGSKVTLSRKADGDRTQLWRMTPDGMLQHEGTSPPHDLRSKKPRDPSNILVLDVVGAGPPIPGEEKALMLRKPDPRRKRTQTWHFSRDGRLNSKCPNFCVQAKDGFSGLRTGNDVVLGPISNEKAARIEEAVSYQWFRLGSGKLCVEVIMDGPTRVLQINDSSDKPQRGSKEDFEFIDDGRVSRDVYSQNKTSNFLNLKVKIELYEGIGISLLSHPEEVAYIKLSDIIFCYSRTETSQDLDFSIKDIQVDNQLPDNPCSVVLYVTPQGKDDHLRYLPTLQVLISQDLFPHKSAYIFKNALVTFRPLTVALEESFLCKLLSLFGYNKPDKELEKEEESPHETQRLLAAATSANAIRLSFSHLQVCVPQVTLSVFTCQSLTPELKNIRRKLGLSLVQFENAQVNLRPFVRDHAFETSIFLIDSLKLHYEMELRSQAMKILGSTDFLGNPIGLITDVKEGVQELVLEGNLSGLVLNLAHGMANSTAKMTGSLSNVVSKATMDKEHDQKRQKNLTSHNRAGSSGHIVSGVKGLGIGLYGGLTSVVSQTYQGASREGLPGFFSGLAKGVIGTVAKPTSGILDLATGTATAVRDKSKNPFLKLPPKIRKPRLVVGVNGLTPRFNENDAKGQNLMKTFVKNPSDTFVCFETIDASKSLKMLVTSSEVMFLTELPSSSKQNYKVSLRVGFDDLIKCVAHHGDRNKAYVELTMKSDWDDDMDTDEPIMPRKPKVICSSYDIAVHVCSQINHANNLHGELKHTVHSPDDDSPISDK